MCSTATTITERRRQRSRRIVAGAAALTAALTVALTGGCERVNYQPHSSGPSSNPFDDSAHPLSDDQAMAQVVEPAKQIVAAADLQSVSGGFSFASCNDQGDPPYQGTVTIHFLIQGDPDAYFEKVQNAMVSHGWNLGAPPGLTFHGTTLNKNGVTANMGFFPSDHTFGEINLSGECRNNTDHHNDGKTNGTNITDQLQAR
jgi:hypothetical protein